MRISSDKKNMNSKWLFISYSRKNKETALRLAKDLKNYGIAVWLDLLNLEPGTHWDIAIQNALEDSRGLIVLLSIPSVASKYVLSEIDCALEQNKKIIPILLEECRVPLLLRRVQYIDFTQSYDDGYYLLLENFDKYSELDFYSKKEDVRVIEETNEGFVQTNLEEKLISTEEIQISSSPSLVLHIGIGIPQKRERERFQSTKFSNQLPNLPSPVDFGFQLMVLFKSIILFLQSVVFTNQLSIG